MTLIRARSQAGAHEDEPSSGLRILVLHQHYWPEIAATAQILSDLCEDLAAFGHDVTVVCGQPSYRGRGALASTERHRGVTIHRVWAYAPERRSLLGRVLHYTTFFGTSLTASFVAARPDVCLVMSTPPLLLGVSGTLLRLLRGIPFVYSVQDLYPDVAIHLSVIGEHGLPAQAIGGIANVCYGAASAIVALSQGMASKLESKGVPPERISIIPNWADTSKIEPQIRNNAFARLHNLTDDFVVQYSGNLGLSQGLESVLSAAALLRNEPITWLFVGDGSARANLEREARASGLPRVKFLPPQPREHLSEVLGSCDVGLVPMKRGVAHDLVPSKLYGIMAAGRPVLAAVEHDSEVARVIDDADCGWLVEPESPEAIARGVLAAMRMGRSEREALGQRGRAACIRTYSRSIVTEKYDRILRSTVPARSTAPDRLVDGRITKALSQTRSAAQTPPVSASTD